MEGSGRMRRLLRVTIVTFAALVVGASLIFPRGPAPLPLGAEPLAISTGSPSLLPTVVTGCLTAQLADVRLVRQGDRLAFVNVETTAEEELTWPYGFSARLHRGRAELVAPNGSIFATEGDVLTGFGGGLGPDDRFHVCALGRVEPDATS